MNLEQEYGKFRKRHKKLPEWKWVSANFDMRDDSSNFTLNLRRAMFDRVSAIARNVIEPWISSSENYCCWFEKKFISQTDKDELFAIYRELQSLIWKEVANSLRNDDKELVAWIIDVKRTWDKTMPKLSKISYRVSDGWKSYTKETGETAYHG